MINTNPSVALDFDKSERQICVGTMTPDGTLATVMVAADKDVYSLIREFRAAHGYVTNADTFFRVVPASLAEETTVVRLAADVRQLDDAALVEWLNRAEHEKWQDEDGFDVFKFPFTASVYDYTRLATGEIALTEVARDVLNETSQRYETAFIGDAARLGKAYELPNLICETRLRALLRYVATTEPGVFERKEAIGLFAATSDGVGFAVWNKERGFFLEIGDKFGLNFNESDIPPGLTANEYVAEIYAAQVTSFLLEQVSPILAEINLRDVFWIAVDGLRAPLRDLIGDLFERETTEQIIFSEIQADFYQAVVSGLLAADAAANSSRVGTINLFNDLRSQLNDVQHIRHQQTEKEMVGIRRASAIYLLLPLVCTFGLLAGLFTNFFLIGRGLDEREAAARSEKSRLQPILNERAEAEKTRIWFEDLMRQIIALRKKQAASLSFAAHLDPLIPPTDEFYISEMKLISGEFEIRGLARNQVAVSEFVKSLEFTQSASGERIFTNLSVDFRQGTPVAAAAATTLLASTGSGVTGSLAPGIAGFFIKGVYPAAQILKPQTPPASTGTAPAPVKPAAAAAATPNQPVQPKKSE